MYNLYIYIYIYIYIYNDIYIYRQDIFDEAHSQFSDKAEHHIVASIWHSIPSGTSAQALQWGWHVLADQGNIVLTLETWRRCDGSYGKNHNLS